MIRRHLITLLAGALLAVAAGCAQSPSTETASSEGTESQGAETHATESGMTDKVAKAAAIAVAIEKNPDSAEAILKEHGVTREAFEALMFEIAQDAGMSEAYEKARMEAGS